MSVVFFLVAMFEMIALFSHIYGCYSRALGVFSPEGFFKDLSTLHTCAFFYTFLQVMDVLFLLFRESVDQSDVMTGQCKECVCLCVYECVCVCHCHRLQSGFWNMMF